MPQPVARNARGNDFGSVERAKLALPSAQLMIDLDQRLFLWVNTAFSGPAATSFFTAITWLGNGLVLAVLIVPAMRFRDPDKLRLHLFPLVASVATTGTLVTVMKHVIGRDRPPLWAVAQDLVIHAPLEMPSDKSFPSGHAQTSMATAVYLSLVYPRAAPVFVVLALSVGLSRIALGVHFPLDVLVGASLGAAGSWVAFRWARRRMVSMAPRC